MKVCTELCQTKWQVLADQFSSPVFNFFKKKRKKTNGKSCLSVTWSCQLMPGQIFQSRRRLFVSPGKQKRYTYRINPLELWASQLWYHGRASNTKPYNFVWRGSYLLNTNLWYDYSLGRLLFKQETNYVMIANWFFNQTSVQIIWSS